MTCTTRQVALGKVISLEIDVTDIRGNAVDADSTPSVAIIDPSNATVRALSNTDVVRVQEGRYRFNYTVASGARTGIWIDRWVAIINGISNQEDLNFTVLTSTGVIEAAGPDIGDDPVNDYTEAEICGINILMSQLKCRLKNNVNGEVVDEYGNIGLQDCPIFTNDELLCFLQNSLSEFNQTPHFTALGFDSDIIYERNANIIVEGAVILALAAQMLIEAGRELSIQDNGITFQPPPLSNIMNNQMSTMFNAHMEKLKQIKWSMKPAPIGFGSFRLLAIHPAVSRLRHLRGRRIL